MSPPNPSAPDTGSKCVYPSEELIRSWWEGPKDRGCNAIETVARKAADWQREQDATKAEYAKIPESCYALERILCNVMRVEIALAIRAKSQGR